MALTVEPKTKKKPRNIAFDHTCRVELQVEKECQWVDDLLMLQEFARRHSDL